MAPSAVSHTSDLMRAASPRSQRRADIATKWIDDSVSGLEDDDRALGKQSTKALLSRLASMGALTRQKLAFLCHSVPSELAEILDQSGAPASLGAQLRRVVPSEAEDSDSESSEASDAVPYAELVALAVQLHAEIPDWRRTDMRAYLEEATTNHEFNIECAVDEAFSPSTGDARCGRPAHILFLRSPIAAVFRRRPFAASVST